MYPCCLHPIDDARYSYMSFWNFPSFKYYSMQLIVPLILSIPLFLCFGYDLEQVNMNEKDYQRKKNKFLPKIHAWYVSARIFINHPYT